MGMAMFRNNVIYKGWQWAPFGAGLGLPTSTVGQAHSIHRLFTDGRMQNTEALFLFFFLTEQVFEKKNCVTQNL